MAIRADDSSLDPDDLRAVEGRARMILDKSATWGRYPTPVDDILAAANLRVESKSLRDAEGFLAFLTGKAALAAEQAVTTLKAVKSALSKVFGIYDPADATIHIDEDVARSKQTFLKLHQTGHHELPAHRKLFRFFQDCEKTLAPDIADRFEREANNFARFALFQEDGYASMAADHKMAVKTPMALASKFGARRSTRRAGSSPARTTANAWSSFSTRRSTATRRLAVRSAPHGAFAFVQGQVHHSRR